MSCYAGQVVRDSTGLPLGTLCVIDRKPHRLDDAQRTALGHLGWLVEQELARADEIELIHRVTAGEAAKSLIVIADPRGAVLFASGSSSAFFGDPDEDDPERTIFDRSTSTTFAEPSARSQRSSGASARSGRSPFGPGHAAATCASSSALP